MEQRIEQIQSFEYNPAMAQRDEVDFPLLCKQLRAAGKWTQEEMAKKFGVHVVTWKRWESGDREPSAQAAFRLCKMQQELIAKEEQAKPRKK